MSADISSKIDEARLEKVRETLRHRSQSAGRQLALLFVRHLAIGLAVFFVVLPILDGRLPVQGDFTGPRALIRSAAALLMALITTGVAYRALRNTLKLGLTEHRNRLQAEWDRWVGSRWLSRTLRWGLLLTAAVGLPVGLLVSLTMPPADLPGESRPLMLLIFLAMTSVWAVPMTFGIRWMVLRKFRSLMGPGQDL